MKNVVLLTIDTLRKDALSCYGGPRELSPFFDSIQGQCLKFTKAQSCGPYTQASFPAILASSYYLDYVREEKAQKKLSSKRSLVSQFLQFQGITTAGFHSNAYLWDVFGWNRGWDTFYDSSSDQVDDKIPYIRAGQLNDKLVTWFLTNKAKLQEKPFFLWLHYMDVHEPYVPERQYLELVDPDLDLDEDEMMRLFHEVLLKRDLSDPHQVEVLKKLYMAHVKEVDEATEQLFNILKQTGHLPDTTVIITADHGDEFGEHGGLSHDGKAYCELIDVPLIIYDPSLAGPQSCDKVVSTLDVSPTILHLFGLDEAGAFEGSSLLPLETYPDQGSFGGAIGKHGSTEAGELKGVFFHRRDDLKISYYEEQDRWELYDLQADPGETKNLVASHPQAEAMKASLAPHIKKWQEGGR